MEKSDLSSKDMAKAQRNMDTAYERSLDFRQMLSHNLLSESQLFDGDLPVHTHKSLLVGEIEHKLDLGQWS